MKNQNKLLSAILTLVLGILFIILKGQVISIAMTVLGVTLIVLAVVDYTKKKMQSCIIKAVIGVLVILFGWLLVSLALYIMAALLLIYGILQLYENLKGKSKRKNTLNLILKIAEPVICIVAAFFLLFNQGGAVSWVFILSGIFLIVNGVLALVECLK